MPLHPAIVHIPVALALLLPLLVPFAAYLWLRNKESRTPFIFITALGLMMAVGAFIATETGEDEEDIAERVVPKSAIHEHEEAAEIFLWLAIAVALVGAGTTAAAKSKAALPLTGALWILTLVTAFQAYQTGEAGGELVYKYNAGAAYLTPGTAPGSAATPVNAEDEHDD